MAFKQTQCSNLESSNSTYSSSDVKKLQGTIFSKHGWGSEYVDNNVKWNVPLPCNDSNPTDVLIYGNYLRPNLISGTHKEVDSFNVQTSKIMTANASNTVSCNNFHAYSENCSTAREISKFEILQKQTSVGEKPWKNLPEFDDNFYKKDYHQTIIPGTYHSKQIEAEKKRNDVRNAPVECEPTSLWNAYQTGNKKIQHKFSNDDPAYGRRYIGNYRENYIRPVHQRMVVKTVSQYC